MNVFIRLILMSCLLTTLAGCSYFSSQSAVQGRTTRYRMARSIPPMRIPPGISSSSFHTLYPVSDHAYSDAAMDVSLVPPGLND